MKTTKNEKEAFLQAYDDYSDGLFRYALFKTSNRELALDLTQDTFTKAWEYYTNGQKVDKWKPFLYRIITNLIIDSYRKKKSESLDSLMESGFDQGADNREVIENTMLGEELWKIVPTLEEKYAEVITLRYMNDFSIEEIAVFTGESENNISVRLHRALKQIKEKTQWKY